MVFVWNKRKIQIDIVQISENKEIIWHLLIEKHIAPYQSSFLLFERIVQSWYYLFEIVNFLFLYPYRNKDRLIQKLVP